MLEEFLINAGIGAGVILGIVAVSAAIMWILRRERVKRQKETDVLLAIEVPKENEKTPLAAEQLFASLHGLYRKFFQRLIHGSVSMSFEIAARKGRIRFFAKVPLKLMDFVSKQLYAQYPDAKIYQVDDYVNFYDLETLERDACVTNIATNRPSAYPIRTFVNFEVDPLSAITSALSGLQENEDVWFQMVVSPVNSRWQARAREYIHSVRQGKVGLVRSVAWGVVREIIEILFVNIPRTLMGKTGEAGQIKTVEIPDHVSEALSLIEAKATKLGYSTKLRLVCISRDKTRSQQLRNEFISTLQQFTLSNLNGFKLGRRVINVGWFKEAYALRNGNRNSTILNTEELASIFHLPSVSVSTPNIVWSRARKGEPPPNLPITTDDEAFNKSLTIFAKSDFRHEERKFGLKQIDRLRHLYVIGKTGMGKSTMLSNMAIDDIRSDRGVAVLDPHGDLVDTVMRYVPKKRINDVILFNPSDKGFPIALNMLESVDPAHKSLVASGLIAVFHKLYENTWGPRLEHILRNTILALLDYPDSTLLGIPRMFSDLKYRAQVVSRITNPTVAMFWTQEFTVIEKSRAAAEALGAVQNKVGQFLSTPIVRNIVGQPKSTIDFRSIMDNNKIILVNLSKGLIGEDVSSLLGSMLITKIQLAAMSRSDTPEDDRVPFQMYVDEFQNFATTSFAGILSEARKYKLGLTMANQYIAQMPEEVRDAVFGNVGTLISFAVGATDAKYITSEFAPVFTEEDMVHLDKYNVYLRMTIDGLNSEPFSATTLPLPKNQSDNTEKVLRLSRERYSKPMDKVEQQIFQWAGFRQLEEGKAEKVTATIKDVTPPAKQLEFSTSSPSKGSVDAAVKQLSPSVLQPVKPTALEMPKHNVAPAGTPAKPPVPSGVRPPAKPQTPPVSPAALPSGKPVSPAPARSVPSSPQLPRQNPPPAAQPQRQFPPPVISSNPQPTGQPSRSAPSAPRPPVSQTVPKPVQSLQQASRSVHQPQQSVHQKPGTALRQGSPGQGQERNRTGHQGSKPSVHQTGALPLKPLLEQQAVHPVAQPSKPDAASVPQVPAAGASPAPHHQQQTMNLPVPEVRSQPKWSEPHAPGELGQLPLQTLTPEQSVRPVVQNPTPTVDPGRKVEGQGAGEAAATVVPGINDKNPS